MKSRLKLCFSLLLSSGLIFGLLSIDPVRPVRAAVTDIFINNQVFLANEDGYYGDALQQVLATSNNPLTSYTEQINDQPFTIGDIIWTASQQMDFSLNPKILLAILYIDGKLDQIPTSPLMPYTQNISIFLWQHFNEYQAGNRDILLNNGQMIQITENNNASTYALACYFAQNTPQEIELTDTLIRWNQAYQNFFGQDPREEPTIAVAAPSIPPFLSLPFDQPVDSFIKINSFFDHASPNYTKNGTIVRFDGKTLPDPNSATCLLGVSCYDGHDGLDYSTGAGRPMLAAADGKVIYAYYNTDPAKGTVDSGVIIDHLNGYQTAYWHMDPIAVKKDDIVLRGDVIGLSGNIGRSSGAHLHFNVRLSSNGKDVDPYGWWSTTVTDPWGDSQWLWSSDLTADNREAQAQLFYRDYWNRDANGYNGDSYWTNSMTDPAKSTNWAVWGTYLSSSGYYKVYAYWPKRSDNTTSAKYQIFHAGLVSVVTVNQSADGDHFVYLGNFYFNKGGAAVLLTDLTNDYLKRIYFDAIKWDPGPASPPTNITLSNLTLAENQPSGTQVGTLSTTDPDQQNGHTYTLVAGIGSTDNALFSITDNVLKTTAVLDYETKINYSIRVCTTDATSLSYENVFQISLTPVNEFPPTNILLTKSVIGEHQATGTIIGNLNSVDLDGVDPHTYSLVSGTGSGDNSLFTISSDQLKTGVVFNYEDRIPANYMIRIRTTDSGGLTYEKQFIITIQDRQEIWMPLIQ